jgi:aspartokinase-like uncharacterized kinase
MSSGPIVVKVGGSLFDLPDLGPRLRDWLATLSTQDVLLVPGGGPTADVVRRFDRCHRLGEETSHWLAVQALALNAHFLAALLPDSDVVGDVDEGSGRPGGVCVLDAHRFALADEFRPGCLPHDWSVTGDSIAARAAVVADARRLVLLKSVNIPEGMGWAEAGRRGFVDPFFAEVSRGLSVEAVNFRAWRR